MVRFSVKGCRIEKCRTATDRSHWAFKLFACGVMPGISHAALACAPFAGAGAVVVAMMVLVVVMFVVMTSAKSV
jgi:hypothetical protein